VALLMATAFATMGYFFHSAAFLAVVMIQVEWSSGVLSPYVPLVSSLYCAILVHPPIIFIFVVRRTTTQTVRKIGYVMDLAPHFTVGSTKEQMRTVLFKYLLRP
jgi:hypothetical protein